MLRKLIPLLLVLSLSGCAVSTTPVQRVQIATKVVLNHAEMHRDLLSQSCAEGSDRACRLASKFELWIALGRRFEMLADGEITADLKENALLVIDAAITELQVQGESPLLIVSLMDLKSVLTVVTQDIEGK